MGRKTAPLLPGTEQLLRALGERLRLARLRRKLSAKMVADRAGMSVMTLRGAERGEAGVTVGAYLSVMQTLGLERDIDLLAAADPVGRALQDSRLPARRTPVPQVGRKVEKGDRGEKVMRDIKRPEPGAHVEDWRAGYASYETLKDLLKHPPADRDDGEGE